MSNRKSSQVPIIMLTALSDEENHGDGDTYSMIPPTDDVASDFSVDVTKDNGKTVHIGNYSTVEELDKSISDAVNNGQLTQEEADTVRQ